MSNRFRTMLGALWRSTSALVAVVLIIAAFVAGLILRPGPSRDATAPTTQPAEEQVAADVTYTCSMHPQIRQPQPGRCPICAMDLIPVGVDDTHQPGDRELVMSAEAVKLAEIRTTPVVREHPTVTVRLFGNVDYDETRIATIAAYFPARLERLFVDYTGVPVKQGEHLAVIYSPDLISTQEELRQALAAVESSRGDDESVRIMNEALLQAAREKLRLWGLTPEQIAGLERADEPLEQLTIYSPVSGVVIEKTAVEGMYVGTGDEIYKVADLSRLWVRLEAYESQLPWLRYGQDVTFTTESVPGEVFEGTISFINPVISRDTRTVQVRVIADNQAGRLKPGMFVRAAVRPRIAGSGVVLDETLAGKWICPMHPEIIKDEQGRCDLCDMPLSSAEELGYAGGAIADGPPLVIPATAPLITGRRAVVYVRVPDRDMPTFEGREVVLGPRAGDLYIVQEGLEEGEAVVVNGAFKIDSALQIVAKPSMMDPLDHDPADTPPSRIAGVTQRFLEDLDRIYAGYFAAQAALADDDLEGYRRATRDLTHAMTAVSTAGLGGEARERWQAISSRLSPEEPADLDQSRADFDVISAATIELQHAFGHLGPKDHFVVFCPMAFDNRGASWLSPIDEVRNPYFGAAMYRCGAVRKAFEPRVSVDP